MKLVYDQNNARIYHGDARNLDALEDGSVQAVITSPPYFNAKVYSSWPTYQDYLEDMSKAWKECFRVLCDGGRIAVNVAMGYDRPGNGGYKCMEADTTNALKEVGFEIRGHIIWVKSCGNGSPNSRSTAWGSWKSASNPCLRDGHEVIIVAHKGSAGREKGISTITGDQFMAFTNSVWDINPVQSSWHPAPFPGDIPYRLIQLYTYQNDVVLDPFLGSGTTVFTAANCGRFGIGVEQNLDYIKQAVGPMFMVTES